MRLCYVILLCVFSINACLAITLTQYAQAQTYEISPDIECKNEEYKVVCNVENVEWIDGVVAKKFQYILELQEDTLLKHRYFEFHTQNLNFEGYNLTALIPDSILCVEKSKFTQDKPDKSIQATTECTMQSSAYHIVAHANFITTHPMYNTANSLLEAHLLEHERFRQPLQHQDDETWQKDYKIAINNATIWIKSTNLNEILFDLYKREQHIATSTTSQDDRDYRIMQDSILTKDYLAFLQKSFEILNAINKQANLSKQEQQGLTKVLHKLIAIATTPNQSLSLRIKGGENLILSLYELESLTAIDNTFFDILAKILKYSHIKIA